MLRELVQNALDAVRLQRHLDEQQRVSGHSGRVTIRWDSRERTLSVEDNGTGMTQEIIEKHLLKVGASRYQDPEFRKQHPTFSAISRFGIGVLSTFMIADTVEVVSCHPDEEQARQLSLRSVHGKYLIRLLDKHADEPAPRLAPHGTLVTLKVRSSADMGDVIETARKWIVVPGCEVSVVVDGGAPVQVGFPSPREALARALQQLGIPVGDGPGGSVGPRVRIDQAEIDGVTVAYAVEWSEYFREWSFLNLIMRHRDVDAVLLGTCVEGVRVEPGTPGFNGVGIAALANARGPSAPRTTVARSGFEATPERNAMHRAIYSALCGHVGAEVRALHEQRAFSLTWATQESRYLMSPLLPVTQGGRSQSPEPLDLAAMVDQVTELPTVLVERAGGREAVSPANLRREPCLWTIDCALFRSAEMLFREVPGGASLSSLVSVLGVPALQVPDGPVLCGFHVGVGPSGNALVGKEVDTIAVYPEQRRVDLRWREETDPPRWTHARTDWLKGYLAENTLMVSARNAWALAKGLRLGQTGVAVSGLSDEMAVRAFGETYLLPNCPMVPYLTRLLEPASVRGVNETGWGVFVLDLVARLLAGARVSNVREYLRDWTTHALGEFRVDLASVDSELEELQRLVDRTTWKVFDPSAWQRDG